MNGGRKRESLVARQLLDCIGHKNVFEHADCISRKLLCGVVLPVGLWLLSGYVESGPSCLRLSVAVKCNLFELTTLGLNCCYLFVARGRMGWMGWLVRVVLALNYRN